MTETPEDESRFMHRALAEAERGRGAVEPNPLVGAVIVRSGRIVGVGHHARFGGPHAEIVALEQAGGAARGGTLFVTLEPCCHHGKTPPCTESILTAGIARVVAAMSDPFPKVAGGGLARLREAGTAVEVGLGAAVARRLNAPYLKRMITGRPYVIAKWAMTLDGKTACASGDSRWISGPRSRAVAHELRGRMDAIVVGIGTALTDDPLLTARPPGPRIPIRIVLDSAARLPISSQLARTAREAPVWVAVTERAAPERTAALAAAGCHIQPFGGAGPVPIPELLDQLGSQGATNVLVEGGGGVLGAFLDAGEVDAVEVFIAPLLEGGAHAHQPVRGRGVDRMAEALRLGTQDVAVLDADIHLRGTIARPWSDQGR